MSDKKPSFFKTNRQSFLTAAFALLWIAFPVAYLGGTGGNPVLTGCGFGLIGIACGICILAGK